MVANKEQVLILGTHNRKKGAELLQLLAPHGFQLRTLGDVPDAIEVEETGKTFAENAALKATQQAQHLGLWVLGEDSGLSVAALDGRPGVYSARYSGEHATDNTNNQKLLDELANTPVEKRDAHYSCFMALSDPTGKVRMEASGVCQGRILRTPRGSAGFGYDPLFLILEYHQTFGELGEAVKAVISHRARATRVMVQRLLRLRSAVDW